MAKFRKKPVVVEAEKWGGTMTAFTFAEVKVFNYQRSQSHPLGVTFCNACGGDMHAKMGRNVLHTHGWIDTLESGHVVCPGDWIIKGVQDEFHPCKPDIFAATYEPAEALRQSQSLPAGAVADEDVWQREYDKEILSNLEQLLRPRKWLGRWDEIVRQVLAEYDALQADAREKGEAVGWAAIDTRGKPIELFLTEAGAMAWAGWGDDLDPSIKFSHVIPLYATQPAQASEAAGSVSVKQIPRRKAYPKPDENGNETGPIEQHAYIEGWNDCVAAIRLATSSQETASE